MKLKIIFVCIILTMIFFTNNVYAIPPSPNHPCHKEGNCPKDPDQVSTGPSIIKSNKFGITSPILPSNMTTGTKKIVIIPVVFSDIKNSTTIAKLNSTVQNISVYYKENSYNKLNFTVVLIPKWYSLNRNMSSYGADNTNCAEYRDFGRWNENGCNYAWMGSREFVIDSLTISDSEINFSSYDHVIIVHAGNDEASSNVGNDLWSVRWPGLNFSTNDSAIVNGSTILAETSPLGTFLHELAHDLGAPDLYNTANSLSVVGYWDLMDIGSWAGNPQGSNPSHLSSWNKILFKWISPIYVSPSTSYNLTILPLESIATGIKTVKVPMITNSSQEYFLVENRQKTVGTYDASLPESGIVVWHIDDTQNNINNGVIKRVLPENQNPGTSSLDDAAYNQGDQNFAPSTNPNSSMNSGFSSNISIGNWLKNDTSFFVFFNNWYITTTTTSTTTSTSTTSTTISTTTSTSTTTTTIPTTAPVITVISPQKSASYYKVSVPLDFTIDKPISWIGYDLDNKPNVTITGNTSMTGLTDGNHNVIIYANDTLGNMGTSDKIDFFYCRGDINKDKIIDIFDLVNVALAFGSQPGNPNWNVNADLNNDNVIDIFDIVVIATDYGKNC